MFYESYYCQHVQKCTKPFNDERAIRLARRGRIFTKVEHLQTRYVDITPFDLQFVSPYHFPNLKSFYSDMTLSGREFERLRHSRLVGLSVFLETISLAGSITEHRFPKLEVLELDFRARGAQLGAMNPHSTLKRLICAKVLLDANFFKSITKRYFPELKSIEIDSRLNVSGRVFFELQVHFNSIGIKLKNVPRRNI